jgi:hypothetical protein
MEQFAYTSHKLKYHDPPVTGILEEYLETLNPMASSDIFDKPFTEICEMCRN